VNKQSILIVDDNIELCETIADIFWEKGYMVDMAYNGAEADKKFAEKFFNVALLDINLPDIEGTELLGRLKKMHPETEAIMITGYASLESSITALREGAFAYVIKPLAMDEVIAIVEQALEKQKLILIKNMQVTKEMESKERYRILSITDGLTELHNHRYFHELLSREIAMAKRYSHSLSLLMIDIDNFKACNDTYGHLAGDRALRNIAKLLKVSCRTVDIVARYGGEEFAILMPYTDKEGSIVVAERLRGLVEKLQKDPPLTISIGIASYPSDAENEEQLIASADQALYKAKRKKNMVCAY
jgi:diguanylate cyclase (GGDEF)-like protein